MKKLIWIPVGLAGVLSIAATLSGQTDTEKAVLKSFKGAAAFSHKANFSDSIPDLYLAYDSGGQVVFGAALRSFKTYETVTSMLVVRKIDGRYMVFQTDVPDIGRIKDAVKRQNVMGVIQEVAGRMVKDDKGRPIKIDATTGATRYTARIYQSFDLMARKVIEQMEANPPWTRSPLPGSGT